MQMKEYALYKGDELLAMGTKREIAEKLGVSVRSVEEHSRRLVEL